MLLLYLILSFLELEAVTAYRREHLTIRFNRPCNAQLYSVTKIVRLQIKPTTETESDDDRIKEGSELEPETANKRYRIRISGIGSKQIY